MTEIQTPAVDVHVEEELSDHVTLPIGIEKDGIRYREVVIDELGGTDEQLIANKKKTGGNSAKGLTLVLCRSIQEIDGLVSRKRKPEAMLDRSLIRGMYQVDRDFLFSRIQLLTGNDETQMRGQCKRCKEIIEEDCMISEIPIVQWPADQPCELEFSLPRGYHEPQRGGPPKVHRDGVLRFPRGIDQENAAPIAATNTGKALTAMLAACITKLGTLENVDTAITERLKSRDRAYLFRLLREKLPGMRSWKVLPCWNCGNEEVETIVDISAFFG